VAGFRNSYTFGFAAAVCVVCATLLATVSSGLKPRRDLNIEIDRKQNILKAVRLETPLPEIATGQEVLSTYAEKILELEADGLPIYVYREGGETRAWCHPVSGPGLWGVIHGYLALEADGLTIRGITFYRHAETPGLGAEIERDWFQDNFRGKPIRDASGPRPPVVVKGRAAELHPGEESRHYVDGITGATLTSNGVTDLLADGVRRYNAFFESVRAGHATAKE
jgi:Na+-transporting NADH:ubiquinone oxidoreductase subunit C